MSDTSKKQSFLHGTMLLTMSAAIVKIIGAFYSIPLKHIIGDDGFSYYSTAYNIYTLLLMISTAGLPVAMSRMISQANSLGHYRQVRRIYTVARTIFLTLGLAGTLLMTLFCRQLANFQGQPDAWATIAVLGPCCFLICLMSTYRGFFQGQSNMRPTSVSQVLEAVCKLIVGLSIAAALIAFTTNAAYPAAGAIFGVTMSCLISSFYLGFCFHKAYKDLPTTGEEFSSRKDIAKGLLAVAIPITIGSAGLQLLTVLETTIYMGQLKNNLDATLSTSDLHALLLAYIPNPKFNLSEFTRADYIQKLADVQKGIYDFNLKIFNMPCAFITPITISAIPAITAQITKKEFSAAKATEESAARVTALISAPCAVGLAVLAGPVTGLLGSFNGPGQTQATSIMVILGICILFNATVLLTTAIMQAHGHVNLPVINMFVGGAVKLVTIFILTRNPAIGILGVPIGSLLCYLCIAVLNLIVMAKVLPNAPRILRNMIRPILAAVIMGVIVFGVYCGVEAFLAPSSRIISCGIPLAVGVVVYVITALLFKSITREDCLLLPKGEKIAKLLHL